jgi:hypothetical protein
MNSSFTESELGEIKELFDQVSKVLLYPSEFSRLGVCVYPSTLLGEEGDSLGGQVLGIPLPVYLTTSRGWMSLFLCKRCLVPSQHKLAPNRSYP